MIEGTEQKLITQIMRENGDDPDYDVFSAMAALDSVYDDDDVESIVAGLLERYDEDAPARPATACAECDSPDHTQFDHDRMAGRN